MSKEEELTTFLEYEDFVDFIEIFADVDEFSDDKTEYNYLRNFEEHYQNCLTPYENYMNLIEFMNESVSIESIQKEKEKNYIIRINGIKFDNTFVNKPIAETIKTYYNSKGYDDVIIEEVKETE